MALLSQDEALLSLLLPQGVASLRSLALGWELIAPPGRADVAGGDREICVGRFSGDVGGAGFVLGGMGICVGWDGDLRWAGRRLQPGTGAGMTGVQIKPRRGCKLTAQGKRAKRCDTLGLAGAKTMRPRRGQKQRLRGCFRGFCPLRGRNADAMRTHGALRKNRFSAGGQRRGKMRRVVWRRRCSSWGWGTS